MAVHEGDSIGTVLAGAHMTSVAGGRTLGHPELAATGSCSTHTEVSDDNVRVGY